MWVFCYDILSALPCPNRKGETWWNQGMELGQSLSLVVAIELRESERDRERESEAVCVLERERETENDGK